MSEDAQPARNWREAKPKWVVDAAEAELASLKRRAALSWPDAARPTPVPFRWGGYDRCHGTPVAGDYFFVDRDYDVTRLRIAPNDNPTWTKPWKFSTDPDLALRWSDSPIRGSLYATRREAALAALWEACDKAAEKLEAAWSAVYEERSAI